MTKTITREQFAQQLSAGLARQLELNEKLGVTLLEELEVVARDGRPIFTLLEGQMHQVGTSKIPDRDWARCYGHYRGTIATLLTEERERTKLRLLHDKQNPGAMTDEEYAAEMRQLEMDAVRGLGADEFAAEAKRRGLDVPVIEEERDGD